MKAYIKMEKTVIKFGDTEIEKHKFHQRKQPILINNVDINKTLVSNKVSFHKKGFKYLIRYNDAKKIRPLCIFLSKLSAHRREFDGTKFISYL